MPLAYLQKKPTSTLPFPPNPRLCLLDQAKLLRWFELKVRMHKLSRLAIYCDLKFKKEKGKKLVPWWLKRKAIEIVKAMNNYKAKIYFWSLHFWSIPVSVSTFLECLFWSLKIKNHYHFVLYRHLINENCIRDRRSAPFAC